nr:replication protein A 70 kDa DNA-binding subunit B-like [Ipomoea batatas]
MASTHYEIVGRELHPRLIWNHIIIRVLRVVRLPKTRCSEEINSIECIIHDVEKTFLHMHIPKLFVQKWLEKPKEGGAYQIHRFLVVYNSYRNKTTTHRYMLQFCERTIIGVLKDADFPTHIYDRDDYDFSEEVLVVDRQ